MNFNKKMIAVVLLFAFITFKSAIDANLAREIRQYTNNGNAVEWKTIQSNYATLHKASYWDGRYIDLTVINDTVAKEQVNGVAYKYVR